MKIGIFDSGIGGEAVAEHLREAYPDASIIVVNDREHVPYGDRPHDEIQHLTNTAIQPLLKQHCDIIIIACNTATAVAIEMLRETYPDQLFIGLEPMVKPASMITKTGIITVCATPATLRSERYAKLKKQFAQHVTVLEPDCSEWAHMIEHKKVDESKIIAMVEQSKEQGADVIVLACTHYHWIWDKIKELAGAEVTILDPSDAVVSRVSELLPLP